MEKAQLEAAKQALQQQLQGRQKEARKTITAMEALQASIESQKVDHAEVFVPINYVIR